jgi:hypothetical protein
MDSLVWFIVLLVILEAVISFDLIKSKTPRRLIAKELVNLNFILIGVMGLAVGLLTMLAASACLATVVEEGYWSGFTWETIAVITIARYIFPIIMLWGMLTGIILFCRASSKPNFLCIWACTKEEIEYKKKKSEESKEKWPKWLKTFDSKVQKANAWQPGFIKRYYQKRKSEKKV